MPSSGESLLPHPKPKKSSPKKSSPKSTTKIEPTLPTSKEEMVYLRELFHKDPEKAEVLKKQLMKSAKKSPKLSLLEKIEIEDRKRLIRREREAKQSFHNRQKGNPKKPKSKRIPRRKKSKRGGRRHCVSIKNSCDYHLKCKEEGSKKWEYMKYTSDRYKPEHCKRKKSKRSKRR